MNIYDMKEFFENLSTCRPYTTPVHISAPLLVPVGYSKTQIVGISNNKCTVRTYRKDRATAAWKLSEEFQLPISYAKELGSLMMREIKYPNERRAHLKKYCEINKRPSDACVQLTNGTDKNNYFFHVDVNWDKYQTYPYTYYQQIPHQNKTFYTNKQREYLDILDKLSTIVNNVCKGQAPSKCQLLEA